MVKILKIQCNKFPKYSYFIQDKGKNFKKSLSLCCDNPVLGKYCNCYPTGSWELPDDWIKLKVVKIIPMNDKEHIAKVMELSMRGILL